MIIRNPIKEIPTPDPDGVTTDFSTSQPYRSGSVSVWLNGMRLIAEWDDGFVELGGTVIQMKEAPYTGDSLTVQFEAAT